MTEWDASGYARLSGLQQAMAAEVLASLDFEGSERVLDVGCGDGRITSDIAGRVPHGSVVGIDPSREMVAFATKRAGATSNLAFVEADARRIPFEDEFDVVVSFNALHWVTEQDEALRAIRSAMKPGGRALLRLVSAGERKSLEDVVEDARESPRWADHFAEFRKPFLHLTPDAYQAMAERAGLEIRRLQVEEKSWDFETRDAFVAFLNVTLVEWTRHLPEVDRTAFIEDAIDRYTPISGNDHTFTFYQMNVAMTTRGGVSG